MNITEVIKKKGLPYRMEGDIMIQTKPLDLRNEGITSLDRFKQNGDLDLRYNLITSVEGFRHNGWLNLSYNQITSLNGFEKCPRYHLGLTGNPTREIPQQPDIQEVILNLNERVSNLTDLVEDLIEAAKIHDKELEISQEVIINQSKQIKKLLTIVSANEIALNHLEKELLELKQNKDE